MTAYSFYKKFFNVNRVYPHGITLNQSVLKFAEAYAEQLKGDTKDTLTETCPNCGVKGITLIDHEGLSPRYDYKEEEINIDNEIYGNFKCTNCGHRGSTVGEINWKIR